MEDDRQLADLHQRERWDMEQWLERTIANMESNVRRGSALQQVLRAERLAANRDSNELEHGNVVDSKR